MLHGNHNMLGGNLRQSLNGSINLTGPKCEKLTIPMCKNIGYTSASFPSYLTHTKQDEAALEVHQFFLLVQSGCSPKLKAFLCSAYAPPCKADKTYLLPCRELCQSAKSGCEGLMKRLGFSWPQHLNCDKLPLESTKQCFNGKTTPIKGKEIC